MRNISHVLVIMLLRNPRQTIIDKELIQTLDNSLINHASNTSAPLTYLTNSQAHLSIQRINSPKEYSNNSSPC